MQRFPTMRPGLKGRPGRAEKLIGLVPEIEESVTTDEMLAVLTRAGIQKAVMSRIMERISWHLNQRTRGEVQVELLTFSKEWGSLERRRVPWIFSNRSKRNGKDKKNEWNLIWNRDRTGRGRASDAEGGPIDPVL